MAEYIAELTTNVSVSNAKTKSWLTNISLIEQAYIASSISTLLSVYGLYANIEVYSKASAWLAPPSQIDVEESTEVFSSFEYIKASIYEASTNIITLALLQALREINSDRQLSTTITVQSSLNVETNQAPMFRMFAVGDTSLQLFPDFDYTEDDRLILNEHQAKSGKIYSYVWGSYRQIKCTLSFVNSSNANTINTWWANRSSIIAGFTDDPGSTVSGKLQGANNPCKTYTDGARQYYICDILVEGS